MAVVSNGTTLIDNGALDSAVPTGALILLQTQTASSSATVSFTSNIDSTYDAYVFKFYDIHPATDNVQLQFNLSTDGGSTYAVTKTTTIFRCLHDEADAYGTLAYQAAHDLAQSTAFATISEQMGSDNDQAANGTLQLFNPSSTTFVKHYISDFNNYQYNDISMRDFSAGYGNTTNPITAIQFKMSSGNIDSGVIKLYGIK